MCDQRDATRTYIFIAVFIFVFVIVLVIRGVFVFVHRVFFGWGFALALVFGRVGDCGGRALGAGKTRQLAEIESTGSKTAGKRKTYASLLGSVALVDMASSLWWW